MLCYDSDLLVFTSFNFQYSIIFLKWLCTAFTGLNGPIQLPIKNYKRTKILSGWVGAVPINSEFWLCALRLLGCGLLRCDKTYFILKVAKLLQNVTRR